MDDERPRPRRADGASVVRMSPEKMGGYILSVSRTCHHTEWEKRHEEAPLTLRKADP